MKRRELLAILGLGGAALFARRYITGGIKSISPAKSTPLTSEVTPNHEFYLTHYDTIPQVDGDEWRLVVSGEVENEISLTIDDIRGLPSTTDYNTLICIGNGIGGDLIGNAKWKGVRMRDVLEMAGPRDTAKDLVLRGADGYMDTFPFEKGLEPSSRFVYEMNDEVLPLSHGYPLRAVVPGLYGIKNVKWIERIEIAAEDVRGYWQKRGWSEEGAIKVMSRIDVPRDGEVIDQEAYTISGIAFGGEYPITRVEVSFDDGTTWEDAELKPQLSRYAWTLWQYPWINPSPGDHIIAVRATDESGRIQKEGTIISRRSFPDGADGYHKIGVNVV